MNKSTHTSPTIGSRVTITRHRDPHLTFPNHRVVGVTTTGYYVSPADSILPHDIELARRGVLPRASEWISEKLIS